MRLHLALSSIVTYHFLVSSFIIARSSLVRSFCPAFPSSGLSILSGFTVSAGRVVDPEMGELCERP